MPLYDYRCETCGDFEAWRKLVDLSKSITCPSCQGMVRRLFSPPNVILNSGSFPQGRHSGEPRRVKRTPDEPSQPRSLPSSGSRPCMIGHASKRL